MTYEQYLKDCDQRAIEHVHQNYRDYLPESIDAWSVEQVGERLTHIACSELCGAYLSVFLFIDIKE